MVLDSIFSDFSDTIFYKQDSELQYQVKSLEKLILEYPNNLKLEDMLKSCKRELKSEEKIEKKLKGSNIGMYIIRDLNIAYRDIKAQIDYIVITPGFIYLIECRNLYGNIVVSEDGGFFRKVKSGNKVVRESIESPLAIGENHKSILKKVWSAKIEPKNRAKFEKAFSKSYKILAVVTGTTTSNLDSVETGLRKKVIKCEDLVTYIEKDLEKFNTRKDLIDSKEEMHGQAYSLMDLNIDSHEDYYEEYKKKFKLGINKNIPNDNITQLKSAMSVSRQNAEKNSSNLRKKLINYRIKKYKQNDVPDYYIFTDEELNLLVSKMPSSVDELRRKRILTPVKIKMFGEDIIKIINTNRPIR